MKVIDLIDLLQDGTLKFEEKENGKYFSLYSPTIDTGRKFLEIYNKDFTFWQADVEIVTKGNSNLEVFLIITQSWETF